MTDKTQEALEALRKLGDSSSLPDLERNSLEVIIRTTLREIEAVDAEGLKLHPIGSDRDRNQIQGWNDCLDHLAASGYLPNKWQPIETAPKIDVEILTWSIECGCVVSNHEDKDFRRGHNHRNGHHQATHWMPLPAPPKNTQGGLNEKTQTV